MAGGQLAAYYVEFGQKGLAQLKGDVDQIGSRVKAAEPVAASAGARIASALTAPLRGVAALAGQVGQRLQAIGSAATVPFAVAATAIGGFVRAGLAGTTMGETLGLQMQLLSREVAQLFIGPLTALIDGLRSVTDWFRSLSGDQQRAIGSMLTWGVGILAAVVALGKLAGGLQVIGGLLTVLSANPLLLIVGVIAGAIVQTQGLGRVLEVVAGILTRIGELIGTVFEAIGNVASRIGSAIGDVFDTVDGWLGGFLSRAGRAVGDFLGIGQSRGGGGAVGQNRQELVAKGGGTEDVRAAFTRFQRAANQTDIPRQQLTEQQRTNSLLERIMSNLTGSIVNQARQAVESAPAPVV